jgi:hypothetical protein
MVCLRVSVAVGRAAACAETLDGGVSGVGSALWAAGREGALEGHHSHSRAQATGARRVRALLALLKLLALALVVLLLLLLLLLLASGALGLLGVVLERLGEVVRAELHHVAVGERARREAYYAAR